MPGGAWNDAIWHSSVLEGLVEIESDDCDGNGVPDAVQPASTFSEYGAGCAGAGGFVPSLSVTGDCASGGTLLITLEDAAPESTALFLLGVSVPRFV